MNWASDILRTSDQLIQTLNDLSLCLTVPVPVCLPVWPLYMSVSLPVCLTVGVLVVFSMRWQQVDLCFLVPQWRRSFTSSSSCWVRTNPLLLFLFIENCVFYVFDIFCVQVLPQSRAGLGSILMTSLWRTTILNTEQRDWVTTLPGTQLYYTLVHNYNTHISVKNHHDIHQTPLVPVWCMDPR